MEKKEIKDLKQMILNWKNSYIKLEELADFIRFVFEEKEDLKRALGIL